MTNRQLKGNINQKDNGLFFPACKSWKGHYEKTHTNKDKDKIDQNNWLHYLYLLNIRLIAQNINVANNPNATATGLNLSSAAGNTTEASAIKPTSDGELVNWLIFM